MEPGKCQVIQIAKDGEGKRLAVRKVNSGEKGK